MLVAKINETFFLICRTYVKLKHFARVKKIKNNDQFFFHNMYLILQELKRKLTD